MASRSEWLDVFLAYDFDESYFKNIDYDDAGHDTDDDDWWGSECDSEDEAEFDFVNPLVGECSPICSDIMINNPCMIVSSRGKDTWMNLTVILISALRCFA